MQPELKQQIMGYYIEETKSQLDTIEERLLNLQTRRDENQLVEALVCASNALIGGATMLGIDSISRTGSGLKSCFQVLQLDRSIKIDPKLKNLFMQVFYALKELVEHLSHPSGLAEAKADLTMSKIDPLLEELKAYLDVLVKRPHDDAPSLDEEMLSLFDDFLLDSH